MRLPESYIGQEVQLNPLPQPQADTRAQPNPFMILGGAAADIGLSVAAKVDKIHEAADVLAATRAHGEASAGIAGQLKTISQKTSDPTEFETLSREAVAAEHKRTRDTLPSDRAKLKYDAAIAGNLRKAEFDIVFEREKKFQGVMVGDYFANSKRREDEAVTATADRLKELYDEQDKDLAILRSVDAIDPAKEAVFRQSFDGSIKKRRADYFNEELQSQFDGLANAVRRNSSLADFNYQAGLTEIDRAVAQSELAPEKITAAKKNLRHSVYMAQGEAMIEANPMEADARLKEGFFNKTLDQAHIRLLEAKTGAAITQIREGLKAQLSEQDRIIQKQLSDLKATAGDGFLWGGNITELQSAVKGTKHEAEFNEIIRTSDRVMTFGRLGLVGQERMLRDMASRPMVGDDSKTYARLESIHKEAREAVDKDGLTYAIRRRVVPNVLPFDINNPASLAERSQAANMASAYLDYPVSPLSDDEIKTEIARFANSKPDQNVATMAKLNAGFTPGQISVIAKQLSANGAGELAQAIGMSSQVPDASSRILKGQEIKRTNPDALPKGEGGMAAMMTDISKRLGGVYRASPKSRDGAIDAIKSVYAWASWQAGDMSGTYKEERLRNAITTVTGGIISFNGDPVLPPRYGIDETQMRQMIAKADLSAALGGITAKSVLNYGKLSNVGPGRYNVILDGKLVVNKNGKDFELNLSGIKPGLPAQPNLTYEVMQGRQAMDEQ